MSKGVIQIEQCPKWKQLRRWCAGVKIHYNNGEKEKIIDNVISIMVVDGNSPIVACLKNGKELTISLNNIEMILDENVFEKGGAE